MSNNNNNFEIKILLFIENLARILYSREGVCKAQRPEVRAGAAHRGRGGAGGGAGLPGESHSHDATVPKATENTAKVVTTPSGVSVNRGGGLR